MPLRIRNEWLAEFLSSQHDLITQYWIEAIRLEHILPYDHITDEQLGREFPPTVDSMIYAFKTGDIEGPRQHAYKIIRQRLIEGIHLPELQTSLHALESAVMRIVANAKVDPKTELDALESASNMYYLVALIAASAYEQLRLEQQQRFATVYEFGIMLSRTLDLETVLSTAVNEVAKYLQAKSTTVLLVESQHTIDEVRASYNTDAHTERVLPEICSALGCGDVVTLGKDIHDIICAVPDIGADKRLTRWRGELLSQNYASLVCIKLHAKLQHLGELVVLWPDIHAFSDFENEFIRAIAVHTANALQNAILYQEALGKRELDVLLNASRLFAASLDTQDILTKLAKMSADAVRPNIAIAFMPQGLRERSPHIAYYASRGKASIAVQQMMEMIDSEDTEDRYQIYMRGLSEGSPVIFHNYDEFPEWWQLLKGTARSGMILPLKYKDNLLGTCTLIFRDESAFDEGDISLAMALTDLASVSIENARLYEYERNIAETLQRSFIPTKLPGIDGYEIAAYYRPAMAEAEVGGDFYDVFPSDRDSINIIIADVSGKGLDAAVQTAMGKYMVRAYAAENPRPGSVLGRFNRAFEKYSTETLFITAFYGRLDIRRHVFTHASAGHNQPIYYSASSDTVTLFAAAGICLGIKPDAEYVDETIHMHPGDVLLLYTDGATDVKSDSGRLELEGLQDIFRAHVHASADEIVRRVFDDICSFANGKLVDDVAIVVLKRLETHR